jgi:hypothetical protein
MARLSLMLFQGSKANPSGVYRVTVDDVDVTEVFQQPKTSEIRAAFWRTF